MTTTTAKDTFYRPQAGPAPTTLQHVIRNLALPVALVTLPIFATASWGVGPWAFACALWSFNRLIQWVTIRFIIGLPQTIAVAVAGFGFLSRAWGVMIGLVLAVHFFGRSFAVPAAILFIVLYTADMVARGMLYANSRRQVEA